MASVLQQQLAAIAAKSTHQLDLRAQKARHSKSLLFEPREAATQSFDTIFQICLEGFEELCVLDSRFSPFSQNLFRLQSKDVDRTEFTAKENQDLDRIIEAFLGLVCGRILLKPAIKAVEWLVRRFRIQDYNTEAVLMTFLPYHSAQVFPTLLSILPSQIPSNFRFLNPYVTSLQSPPRHAILSALISNHALLNGFSQYVFRVARARHQSAVLLGFWASITAQAINGTIDATRSGREAVRQQREEDLLLRILPILQSALAIKDVPEIYLGSCMIMTIVATKISLEDKVLDALMEAVTGAWTEQTIEDGMLCLAVLAEEKEDSSQPRAVTRALQKLENLIHLITKISSGLRVDKLLIATCLAATANGIAQGPLEAVSFLHQILSKGLITANALPMLIQGLFERVAALEQSPQSSLNRQIFAIVFDKLSTDEKSKQALNEAIEEQGDIYRSLLGSLGILNLEDEQLSHIPADVTMDIDDAPSEFVKAPIFKLPILPVPLSEHPSFLDSANEEIYIQYIMAFEAASTADHGIREFSRLPTLSATSWQDDIALLTILVRIWTENPSSAMRTRALQLASNEISLRSSHAAIDLQILYPYLIAGLGDSSTSVRRYAANLCVQIGNMHSSKGKEVSNQEIWASAAFYGKNTHDYKEQHMVSDLRRFFQDCILPNTEASVLDGAFITRLIPEVLKGASSQPQSASNSHDFKANLRATVVGALANHAIDTPSLNVKMLLLNIVAKSGKVADDARKTTLTSLVKDWVQRPESEIDDVCKRQHVDVATIDKAVVGSLSARTEAELLLLKDIAKAKLGSRPSLSVFAVHCLQALWRSMKPPSQISTIEFMMDLAIDGIADESHKFVQGEALEAIRNVRCQTEVLLHLIEKSPLNAHMQESNPGTKRRRTSKSEYIEQRRKDPLQMSKLIRRITIVLELIEGSEPGKHPQLLKGLFNMLAELNTYMALVGSQLLYIQGLIMSCLLAVVKGINASGDRDVDRSIIRVDLVVECVRKTSSTQIHNTALLLISSLAHLAPDLVLHNVMPLFTFMSTTLLRQSDEHSAHVTDHTVTCIVPPLAASLKKRGKDLVSGASELLLSFTTAYEHVPLHRRADLFQNLVETLGADDSLYAVLAMLVEKYSSDPQLTAFAIALSNKFPVTTQLRAYKQYMDLVFDSLKPKRGISDIILGLTEKNHEQIEESIETLLQNLAKLLQSQSLRKRLAKELGSTETKAEAIQTIYSELLDRVMVLSRQTASNADLKLAVDAILASLLALTPVKDFVESSAKLMQTGSDETRQQVFRSLEVRVAESRRSDINLQQVYLEVLPNCCAFIRGDQPVATRHSAITCIDQIVDKFGKKDRAAVLAAAQQVAGPDALGSEDTSLRVISILCFASMIEVLGDEFIAILPQVLSKSLDYLEDTLAAQYIDQNIHSAVFGLASAVLDHLSWLFSAQYLDRIIHLAARSASRDSIADSMQFLALAAQKIGAGEVFAAIQRTWDYVLERGPSAAEQHLRFFQQAVKYHSKPMIAQNASVLFAIILQAFDLRSIAAEDQTPAARYAECFALADRIALDMTLKLNDNTFRPFFIRLMEWAQAAPVTTPSAKTVRKIAFYSFTKLLFDQLKSIVTSYSSFFLDDTAQLFASSSKINNDERERELLDLVLETLTSSFHHDQDDFWQDPTHVDTIMTLLVEQLARAAMMPVAERVIPAIVELAEATASPEHHKAINGLIMGFMRHHDAVVRLAAVKCERAVTERLNFDWLALLPEMLPFISELQEDDDEEVERETLRWVKQIEDVTGESLDSMLQ